MKKARRGCDGCLERRLWARYRTLADAFLCALCYRRWLAAQPVMFRKDAFAIVDGPSQDWKD